ncbi:MAG: SusD/RagB family nutrient-binding outer membrane lipoprotein, partial [Polaribacter sp.]
LNTDADTKVDATVNGSNNNQIAAATILRVYYIKLMAERWGMIPYTESLQGLTNPHPKFNDQLFVYQEIMKELDGALALIKSGTIQGDFMFQGNMDTWKKFGNTLKMVMAINLSEADPALGKLKFNEALGKTIASVSENIFYPFLEEDANDNDWQDRFQTRTDYVMSDTFVNALIGDGTSALPEDPRLPKIAMLALNTSTYVGAPYGAQNTDVDNFSHITEDITKNSTAPGYIFTYAEILFTRAEAAQLKWTTEDPAQFYANGIEASMQQWGVDALDITAYQLANPYVDMKSISYEKWVAQFLQGYNSWTDYRRFKASGMEKTLLPPAVILSNTSDIPNRQGYATSAKDLNKDNYNTAIGVQGADDLNTKLTLFK